MFYFNQIKKYFLSTRHFEDNSRIEFLHRFALRYIDGSKSIDIGFDPRGHGFLSTRRAIITQSLNHWNEPFNNERVSETKKSDILNKLKIYCKEKRIKYIIE